MSARIVLALGAVVVLSGACGGERGSGTSRSSGTTSSSSTSTAEPMARGKQLVGAHNCLSCHSTTGATLAGPTWKGLAGSAVKLSSGQNVTADHDYLVRSIVDPDAQVVEGYASGIMSAVIKPGSISSEEAGAIARYIESLSG